jgi:hypothetical protein
VNSFYLIAAFHVRVIEVRELELKELLFANAETVFLMMANKFYANQLKDRMEYIRIFQFKNFK